MCSINVQTMRMLHNVSGTEVVIMLAPWWERNNRRAGYFCGHATQRVMVVSIDVVLLLFHFEVKFT